MKKILQSFALVIGAGVILSACTAAAPQDTQPIDNPPEATTASPDSTTPTDTSSEVGTTSYTLAEVATHNSASDCWLIVDGSVYNATEFIPNHPGGAAIIKGCGKDATSLFEGQQKHQAEAQAMLETLKIGTLTE